MDRLRFPTTKHSSFSLFSSSFLDALDRANDTVEREQPAGLDEKPLDLGAALVLLRAFDPYVQLHPKGTPRRTAHVAPDSMDAAPCRSQKSASTRRHSADSTAPESGETT